MSNQNKPEKQEIQLLELITKVNRSRKFVLWFTGLFFILGLFFALIIPNRYESYSKFIPQFSSEKSPSSLGGLAALAGIDLNGLSSNNDIPPVVYPSIIKSVPFRLELLDSNITSEQGPITYREYLENKPIGTLEKIKKYTIGLPALIIKSVKNTNPNLGEVSSEDDELLRISENDYQIIKKLNQSISVRADEKEGYVILAAVDEKPMIAAQIARISEQILQRYIIDYKISQSRNLLKYTTDQFFSIQTELYQIQDSLAMFKEQNQKIASVFKQNELDRMQSRYDMVNNVFLEIAMQKAKAELQVEKNTPVFTIISPSVVPNEKSSPNRPFVLLMFTFLGLFFSIVWILIKGPLKEILSLIR